MTEVMISPMISTASSCTQDPVEDTLEEASQSPTLENGTRESSSSPTLPERSEPSNVNEDHDDASRSTNDAGEGRGASGGCGAPGVAEAVKLSSADEAEPTQTQSEQISSAEQVTNGTEKISQQFLAAVPPINGLKRALDEILDESGASEKLSRDDESIENDQNDCKRRRTAIGNGHEEEDEKGEEGEKTVNGVSESGDGPEKSDSMDSTLERDEKMEQVAEKLDENENNQVTENVLAQDKDTEMDIQESRDHENIEDDLLEDVEGTSNKDSAEEEILSESEENRLLADEESETQPEKVNDVDVLPQPTEESVAQDTVEPSLAPVTLEKLVSEDLDLLFEDDADDCVVLLDSSTEEKPESEVKDDVPEGNTCETEKQSEEQKSEEGNSIEGTVSRENKAEEETESKLLTENVCPEENGEVENTRKPETKEEEEKISEKCEPEISDAVKVEKGNNDELVENPSEKEEVLEVLEKSPPSEEEKSPVENASETNALENDIISTEPEPVPENTMEIPKIPEVDDPAEKDLQSIEIIDDEDSVDKYEEHKVKTKENEEIAKENSKPPIGEEALEIEQTPVAEESENSNTAEVTSADKDADEKEISETPEHAPEF